MKMPVFQMIYLVFAVIFLAATPFSAPLVLLACSLVTLTCCKYYMASFAGDLSYFIFSILLLALNKEAVYFAPLFAYDLFNKRNHYLSSVVYLVIMLVSGISPEAKIVLSALSLVAVYLKYLESSSRAMIKNQEKLIDDAHLMNIQLNESYRELAKSEEDKIYISTLNERARIARELHDSIGHLLSSSVIQLGAIKQLNKDETLSPLLTNLDKTLNTGITETRMSLHNLHSDAIDLEYEINKTIEDYSFCPVNFFYQVETKLPSSLKRSFIYIIKEALNNTAKHSRASLAKLSIREFPSFIQLIIRDNGTHAKNKGAGIGLTSIQEHVSELGGNLTIDHSDGFKIHVIINKEQISESNTHR